MLSLRGLDLIMHYKPPSSYLTYRGLYLALVYIMKQFYKLEIRLIGRI